MVTCYENSYESLLCFGDISEDMFKFTDLSTNRTRKVLIVSQIKTLK